MVLKYRISQFAGIVHNCWRDYSSQLVFLSFNVESHSCLFETPENKRNCEPHQQNVAETHQEKPVDYRPSVASASHTIKKDCLPLIAHKRLENYDSSIQNVIEVSSGAVDPFVIVQICELGN